MFKKEKTPSYLESYLAIVESDLNAEQAAVERTHTGTPTELLCAKARIHMKRHAIESLRSPIKQKSKLKFNA